jgi:hypothetical protein
MILGRFTKQPADVIDYDIDFSEWLPVGDTLATATPTVDVASLTLGTTVISDTGIKQWVSAGTDGLTYKVTVTVTTNGGRTVQQEFRVRVKDY